MVKTSVPRLLILFASLMAGLYLAGCASGTVSLDDVDMTINDLHRVVANSMPVRVKNETANGREFYSVYFVPKGGDFEESDGGPRRYIAHVEIIGDQKPYRIDITVTLQKRVEEAHYESDRTEEGMARVISRRIQKALHERREDRNVIDDFRVF